jgi:tripartite-type tricarboxylate transporter receptor subunit TctC
MKKILSIVLFMSMLLALVGCGGTKSGTQSSTAPAAAKSSTATAASEIKWPTKPIQVDVPASAGGDSDLNARMLAQLLSKELGVSVVISPMPGASGTVAMRTVKDAPKDGYSVLFGQSGIFSTQPMGIADFDYNAFEFGGAAIDDNTTVIVANAHNSKFSDFRSLIEYAKAHPNGVVFGTTTGGLTHLIGMSLANDLGFKLHVADFGDVTETTTAMLAGDADINITSISPVLSQIKSGALKPLAVIGHERLADFPDVPAINEFTALEFTKLFAYYFPKGTDTAIINKFSTALEKVIKDPQFIEYCKKYYITPKFRKGQDGLNILVAQQEFFKKAVAALKSSK